MINLQNFKHKTWLDGRLTLINADCLEVMKEIEKEKVDLVLTDPPYGGAGNKEWNNKNTIKATRTGGSWSKKYQEGQNNIKHWDIAPEQEVFDEIFRISQNQIIWGGNYFSLPPTRCFLIWKKLTISEKFSMAMAEYAWTSFNLNAKIFEIAPQDKERFHPTQKPVPLIAWCLNNYSKENDLIFDGFAGSGTILIAAYKTSRRCIGVELDAEYYEKACQRIDEELRQGKLF